MTTYLESSAGVEAGGKTGLTVVFTSIFFALSLFLAPLALIIPSAAFICVTFTIFANNIANGICVALPAYLIMKIGAGKIKEIQPVMYVLVAVCLLYFYTII